MGSALSSIFEWINSLTSDMFLSDSMLTDTLSEGIPALYRYTQAANTAILPIGYTILALFFLLELLRCSTRAENSGTTLSVQMIAGILVKLGLSKAVMDHTPTLLSAIFDGMGHVTALVSNVAQVEVSEGIPQLELSLLDTIMYSINFLSALPYLLVSLIVLVLVAFVWIRSRLMIYMRFIEAYLYLIVAPIPLATLPGGEWSQIGKNFLKNFAAVALEGTLLFATLSFYPVLTHALVQNMAGAGALVGGGIIGALLSQAFFAVLLLGALAGVSRLSKSICSAM